MADRSELMRQMIQICPFRMGSRVRVRPEAKYGADWPGEYVIVSMVWEYQHTHEINIGIASDEEIRKGYGYTDGFNVDDLEPVL
ncbi:hypothetical protein [Bradyrhizobium phage BDU-MI-1]|nr:hypothetical protein [Bradyrhizobium phage BDU-MI-1]